MPGKRWYLLPNSAPIRVRIWREFDGSIGPDSESERSAGENAAKERDELANQG